MTPEPCNCPLAGYCKRHKIEKSETWHRLCQTKESYRVLWDAGQGPGQHDTRTSKGLGDTIEKMLGPIGRAYKKWRKGKCGCERRQNLLNKLFPYGKDQ